MTMFEGGRSEYTSGRLDLKNLNVSPFTQLHDWIQEAVKTGAIEPHAMTLATVNAESHPSARVVLLRGLDTGLVFYTNYLSRKGSDLSENDHAAACFWWGNLERQLRVEGRVEKVATTESDQYFASRPRDSQVPSSSARR